MKQLSQLSAQERGVFQEIRSNIQTEQTCIEFAFDESVQDDYGAHKPSEVANGIQQVFEQSNGRNWLLVSANADIAARSRLRAKKGAFWGNKHIQTSRHKSVEIQIGDLGTRFYGISEISDFNSIYNNFDLFSFFLSTSASTDQISDLLSKWSSDNVVRFNYCEILNSLAKIPKSTLIKYRFSDNALPERILIATNDKEAFPKLVN